MALKTDFFSLNATEFDKALQKKIKALEYGLGKVFAGIVEKAFVELVLDTPQWSGTLAASWNMTVNRASYDIREFPPPFAPFQKGDLPAVLEALQHAEGKKTTFKDRFEARGWSISVANAVPYAEAVENGEVKLRREVGHNPGFMQRFKDRVRNTHVTNSDSSWDYYANTNFLGLER